MKWGELREGDALLTPDGKVWLMLEVKPTSERTADGLDRVTSFRWLDLRTGKERCVEGRSASTLKGCDVLRGEGAIKL